MTGVRSLAVGLLVTLLAALAGCGSNGDARESDDRSTLLVIGDSWVTGGPMNSGPTWPYLLNLPDDWKVEADAIGGTGYLGDEEAMSLTHDGRLDRVLASTKPDLVLVAMGRNDVEQDPNKVVRAARADLRAIEDAWPDAEIVVFSPFSPEVPVEWTIVLTSHLRRLAASLDMDFLDVSRIIRGRTRFYRSSHPNDRGHALIAKKVEAGLRDLGVFPVR